MLDLGLISFFKAQVSSDELASGCLARVVQVHRSRVVVSNGAMEQSIVLGSGWFEQPVDKRPTVGDWVLLDSNRERVERLLNRKSIVQRVVPGTKSDIQLIAANIDTLFIVTSCNEEFNLSRLERYLSLAVEARVTPVVIFTKKDLVDDPNYYLERVKELDAGLAVEVIDARDSATLDCMQPWITAGSTIGIVGSSGVGKSTLVNTLSGFDAAKTGAVREQDKRGRHTTTHRELYHLPGGGMIIDVPGMRELKVGRFDKSASETFPDIWRQFAQVTLMPVGLTATKNYYSNSSFLLKRLLLQKAAVNPRCEKRIIVINRVKKSVVKIDNSDIVSGRISFI